MYSHFDQVLQVHLEGPGNQQLPERKQYIILQCLYLSAFFT